MYKGMFSPRVLCGFDFFESNVCLCALPTDPYPNVNSYPTPSFECLVPIISNISNILILATGHKFKGRCLSFNDLQVGHGSRSHSPDVAIMTWNARDHLSEFIAEFESQNVNKSLTLFVMDNDVKQVDKYRNNLMNATVLTSDDCAINTLKDVIVSRDIAHVHFMYHVHEHVIKDHVISELESRLYKCQVSILQALTDTFKNLCYVYFHIKLPQRTRYNINDRHIQTVGLHDCEIDAHIQADNHLYNTYRILEMNLSVFQRLYNFSYFYVI